jgi:hypothetical protein
MFRPKKGVERAKFLKNDFFLQKKSFFKNLSLSGRSFFLPNYFGLHALIIWFMSEQRFKVEIIFQRIEQPFKLTLWE